MEITEKTANFPHLSEWWHTAVPIEQLCSMRRLHTPPAKENLLLTTLTEEVFDIVLSFVDTPGLSQWEGCCQAARRLSQRTWTARPVSATSFAKVDLKEHYPTPKEQAILEYRTKKYAKETWGSNKVWRFGSHGSWNCLSSAFAHGAFEHPAQYLFHVRLTGIGSPSNVFWEGFVTAEDQGIGLSSSTILRFHARELGKRIQLDGNDPVALMLKHVRLIMVAVPKHSSASTTVPCVVAASAGLHFIARDNRIFFHLNPMSIPAATNQDGTQRGSTTVFPRLVCNMEGRFLGIRLVQERPATGH